MKSVTVNPTWNVPPSIMYNEYMPALAWDPTVLARMGLNVSYGPRLSAPGWGQCARAASFQLPQPIPGVPA